MALLIQKMKEKLKLSLKRQLKERHSPTGTRKQMGMHFHLGIEMLTAKD
jgi:hypothetical protein